MKDLSPGAFWERDLSRLGCGVMRTSARVVGLDDLILLELGGCPDCEANLRPDPRIVFPGAAEKDEVESYLHAQVSSGAMPWAEAQREIAANWHAVYEKIHK